jgi:hypothetical protein
MQDPILHSFVTDTLPDGHPLQWETVHCDRCHKMVHCQDETMDLWIESTEGNHCLPCFLTLVDEDKSTRMYDAQAPAGYQPLTYHAERSQP